jgi:hypothetical protein
MLKEKNTDRLTDIFYRASHRKYKAHSFWKRFRQCLCTHIKGYDDVGFSIFPVSKNIISAKSYDSLPWNAGFPSGFKKLPKEEFTCPKCDKEFVVL